MLELDLKTHSWPAMACGGCGGRLFHLFSGSKEVEVLVECQGCRSVSRISVSHRNSASTGATVFDGKDSDGLLTTGY
ncbi:hypothetical protein AWV80_28405 [Cupriavidus sp. UYMU48A]|nr:hypothetical protein AWV80_28405 [Cupriavidus sp. UYMU48A]